MTSWPSLANDLRNAGRKMIEEFAEGRHAPKGERNLAGTSR
jgi:hypothetical protein